MLPQLKPNFEVNKKQKIEKKIIEDEKDEKKKVKVTEPKKIIKIEKK